MLFGCLDVSKREEVYRFAEEVSRHYGAVHIVINNAGVALSDVSIEKLCYEDFDWIMGINFWGVVYGTKAFLPYLIEQGSSQYRPIFPACTDSRQWQNLLPIAPANSQYAVLPKPYAKSCEQRRWLSRSSIQGGFALVSPVTAGQRKMETLSPTLPKLSKTLNGGHRLQLARLRAALLMESLANSHGWSLGKDAKFLDLLGRFKPDSYDRFMLKHVVQKSGKGMTEAGCGRGVGSCLES